MQADFGRILLELVVAFDWWTVKPVRALTSPYYGTPLVFADYRIFAGIGQHIRQDGLGLRVTWDLPASLGVVNGDVRRWRKHPG
jgi:hypothetical protein